MELVKSHWVADTNRVTLSMPIAKVDAENRLVSGFATLDNLDTSDDIVTADASSSAFSRFRGNIREMHEPIAAGRLVDFREDSFYDSNTDKFYNGVYVTAYVSLGAESTWQKVLDGTLSGFSIGGNITDQETEYDSELGKMVRKITNYDLVELSLVDNPANQLANVFSIVKSNEGTMMKGMAVDTHLVNVFWCSTDEIAKNSTNESETCLSCGKSMEQIGWFEKGEDEAVKTAAAVANFLRQKEADITKDAQSVNGEGGVKMTDEIKKDAEVEATEEVDASAAEQVESPVEEEAVEEVAAEDAASVEEEGVVEAPAEPDFEKMFDDLKDSVKESVAKTVEAVEAKVADATKAFDEKASEFEKSLGELSEKLEAIKTEREDVSKRLDALEKASAVKKSGEVENTEPVKKAQKGSFWGSTFFNEND